MEEVATARNAPKARRKLSIWRVQFSLRGLLSLVTATALVLAGWLKIIEPFQFQAKAADDIGAAGGDVRTANVMPGWLRDISTMGVVNYFQAITNLELPPEATSSSLRLLPRLTWLKTLVVSGAAFHDEQLLALGRLSDLRQLTLRGTTVTPEGVAAFERLLPNVTVRQEYLNVGFSDIWFPLPPNRAWDESMLPRKVRLIDGSPVRVHGHITASAPSGRQFRLDAGPPER